MCMLCTYVVCGWFSFFYGWFCWLVLLCTQSAVFECINHMFSCSTYTCTKSLFTLALVHTHEQKNKNAALLTEQRETEMERICSKSIKKCKYVYLIVSSICESTVCFHFRIYLHFANNGVKPLQIVKNEIFKKL